MTITPEEREQERLLFDAERKRVPELFVREPTIDTEEALHVIGIEEDLGERPIAYLKFMPQDFIVEEISKGGAVHSIDIGPLKVPQAQEGGTYYVDLVKIGASTLETKTELASILAIDEKNVGFSGIKDRTALTSQSISLRNLPDLQKLLDVQTDHFFLKNVTRGKGVLVNGDLEGNKFTITLRAPNAMSREVKEKIQAKIEEIKSDGFWNFFYFQRFGACGTPRLISHILGKLIIKGRYEEALRVLCTTKSPNETPYMNALRDAMARQWGNPQSIANLIDLFPAYFSYERAIIHHLIRKPGDFLGALHLFPDQIRLWVYAYACYLFNRKLSGLIKTGSVPLELPFITSNNPVDWKPYAEFLKEDGVSLPSRSLRDFPFLYIQSRTCPTLQKLAVHNVVLQDHIAVLSFSLPKGSYATTFLMNFFTLTTGLPMVPGVPTESIDAKQLLGNGTLVLILERFKTALENRHSEMAGNTVEE